MIALANVLALLRVQPVEVEDELPGTTYALNRFVSGEGGSKMLRSASPV